MPSVSDAEMIEVFDEMRAIRDRWRFELQDTDIADFKGSVLGGKKAKQKTGKPCDAFQGHASNADSVEWCGLARLQKTARFDLAAYGGEMGACTMAHGWMHRMQFMYSAYMDGDLAMGFDGEQLVGYDEPAEFTEFVKSIRGPAAKRAEWIRKLRPKL